MEISKNDYYDIEIRLIEYLKNYGIDVKEIPNKEINKMINNIKEYAIINNKDINDLMLIDTYFKEQEIGEYENSEFENGLNKKELLEFMFSEFPTVYNNCHARDLLENSIDYILKTTLPYENSLFYNLKSIIPEITDSELIEYIDPNILNKEEIQRDLQGEEVEEYEI